MRNPVWALNLSLLLIFFIIVTVNFLLQRSLPPKQSMVPTTLQLPPRQTISPVDVRRIYENDLFKTYIAAPVPEEQAETLELNPPPAPPMQQIPQLMPPTLRFLEPLKIDLKGIITSSDPHNNKAIIADERSKKELNYGIGDIVEDAEIIRIERNKVIFVRSNGQQEVVFLTQREANKDQMFAPKIPWYEIIHQTSPLSFAINKKLFKERIKNIINLIEMLDITTTHDANGIPIGCVIGTMPADSIGHVMGLRTGDIITSIDQMPVATNSQRAQVFQKIQSYTTNVNLPIQLLRNQQPMVLYVTLNGEPEIPPAPSLQPTPIPMRTPQPFEHAKPIFAPPMPPAPMPEPSQMPVQPLQPMDRKIFAAPPPMVNQMNNIVRDNMKTFGGQAAQIKRTNANE